MNFCYVLIKAKGFIAMIMFGVFCLYNIYVGRRYLLTNKHACLIAVHY